MTGVTHEAMAILMAHDFPGNIRELENAIQRAVVLSRGETIFPEHLPAKVQAVSSGGAGDAPRAGKTIREVERDTIVKALTETGGNRTHAARILGISRRTLQNKIREYEIEL